MAAHAPPIARSKGTGPAAPRAAGRAAVAQAKLAVGPVNDRHEREAERVADSVVRAAPLPAASPPPVISALAAQRAPLAAAPLVRPGPEREAEEMAPPEARAQRTGR